MTDPGRAVTVTLPAGTALRLAELARTERGRILADAQTRRAGSPTRRHMERTAEALWLTAEMLEEAAGDHA